MHYARNRVEAARGGRAPRLALQRCAIHSLPSTTAARRTAGAAAMAPPAAAAAAAPAPQPLEQQQQDEEAPLSSPAAAPSSSPAAAAAAATLPPVVQWQPTRSGEAPLRVVVRPAKGPVELRRVAMLRAEAYYAGDGGRFVESFKRQFAAQEADSLAQRTRPPRGGAPGAAPQCDCLVALDPATGDVVGCIDVRVPQARTGLPASGVPPDEPGGAYLLNVAVDAPVRGRGVGRALMRAAMARAVAAWGAARLFTHVEADNDAAVGLYRGCGFAEHSGAGQQYDGAATLGRLLLLVAEASAVDPAWGSDGGGDGTGDAAAGASASAPDTPAAA